jgi:hypothetical protein
MLPQQYGESGLTQQKFEPTVHMCSYWRLSCCHLSADAVLLQTTPSGGVGQRCSCCRARGYNRHLHCCCCCCCCCAVADEPFWWDESALQLLQGTRLQQALTLLLLLLLLPSVCLCSAAADDPFWWDASALQLLQGTRLQQAVQHYAEGLQQLHGWLLRLEQLHHQQQQQRTDTRPSVLSSGPLGSWGVTFEAVKWARSAVWSRAFTIRGLKISSSSSSSSEIERSVSSVTAVAAGKDSDVDDDRAAVAVEAAGSSSSSGAAVALVPVLDMCDHHPDQRVSWRVVDMSEQQHKEHKVQQQQQHTEQQSQHLQTGQTKDWQQQQRQQQQQVFQFTTLKPVVKVGTSPTQQYMPSGS